MSCGAAKTAFGACGESAPRTVSVVNFGSAYDSFQVPAFDLPVSCGGIDYYVISDGTSLMGLSRNDDEWAFWTNLNGCVSLDDTCTGMTLAPVFSANADDPPDVGNVPEPASWSIACAALITVVVVRRQKKSSASLPNAR